MANPNSIKDAGPSAADKAREAASTAFDKTKEAAHTAYDKTKEAAGATFDKAKEAASSMGEAVGSAATAAAQAAGKTADRLTASAGSSVKHLGETIREKGPQDGALAGATKAVGNTLEEGGKYLEQEGFSGMMDDVTDLIRKNPVPAVLVGIGIGFLIGRTLGS